MRKEKPRSLREALQGRSVDALPLTELQRLTRTSEPLAKTKGKSRGARKKDAMALLAELRGKLNEMLRKEEEDEAKKRDGNGAAESKADDAKDATAANASPAPAQQGARDRARQLQEQEQKRAALLQRLPATPYNLPALESTPDIGLLLDVSSAQPTAPHDVKHESAVSVIRDEHVVTKSRVFFAAHDDPHGKGHVNCSHRSLDLVKQLDLLTSTVQEHHNRGKRRLHDAAIRPFFYDLALVQ